MNQRPRVLHCISHFALGGAERVAFSLIEALQGQIDFSVFAVRGLIDDGVGPKMIERFHQMEVPTESGPRVPMRYGGMLTGAWSMARAIRRFAPDIVHLHAEVPESSYAVLAALSRPHRRRPTIRTVHNSNIWWFHQSMGRWCDRQLGGSTCIGVSRVAQAEMIRLRKDSGGPAFRTPPQIILNGVTPATKVKENWRAADPIEIIFGGRLDQQKGVDLLPDILRQTKLPNAKRARLRLYGDGDLRSEVSDLCKNPPPGWTIELYPPAPDFRERMATADLLIMPSRFEGLPLTVIEAGLAGVPVIATRAPGSTEALPSNHPWLAEPGNASDFARVFSAALADVGSWSDIAATSRQFTLDNFSINQMAQAYAKVYFDLTSGTTSP